MNGVVKTFPGVKALDHAQLKLRPGTVHALMGENGAGKSTLMKCMFGIYHMDEGEVIYEGQKVDINGPLDALNRGIAMVHQELQPIPERSIGENIYVGRYPVKRLGPIVTIDHDKMYEDAARVLKEVHLNYDPKAKLGTLSVSQMQLVEIAKAVSADCKVLILDEPTSSLDEQEVIKLFGLMRDLRAKGVGIIFVTHFLEQVYEVCDRITVLRDGQLVGEYVIEDLPRVQLVSKMLGKELDDMADIKSEAGGGAVSSGGVPVLEAQGLCSSAGIKPFDFSIRKGEVNGFTGLLGSGRSECVRAIFGADHVTGGSVKVDGKAVKIKKPLDAMKQGIGYLPEDRKGDGIVGDLSVRENIILAYQVMKGFFHPVSRAQAEAFADNYIKLLEIKTASADTPIKSLSGGNQQKCILARWLLTDPKYLILDEPTRGIDIGTKIEIQKLVLKLAEKGKSVTFISSEIDEMQRTCSRLLVMRDRKLVGEHNREDLTQTKIMATIAGGDEE